MSIKHPRLRRDVGWFGSFAMGYGDVGPNIFIALGVITLFAGGAAPLAFLIAALIYITVGLAYAELAPTYPYAGGVHVYALKASNTLTAYVAGWAMTLSYLLCISLFAVAAAGYLRYLIPFFEFGGLNFFGIVLPALGFMAGLLIALLLVLNYLGIKYSSLFLSSLVLLGLVIEVVILASGFLLKFDMGLFMQQITQVGSDVVNPDVAYFPWLSLRDNNFLYAVTLAMSSFIGIESIAQAAEETRRPHKTIPRATKMTVVAVVISALLFSLLSTGSLDWRLLASSLENPVAALAQTFPMVGVWLAPLVAVAAFILCYASSNTGVIGISRLVSSMGRFQLLPAWFHSIHPSFRTPSRAIVTLGPLAILLALPGDIPFLASVYSFGALLSYILLMYSFVKLRIVAPDDYRPWKMPGSVRLRLRGGGVEVPLVGILGLVGTTASFLLLLVFHIAGRTLGLLWLGVGMILYVVAREMRGARIIGREESSLVIPMAYRMRLAVLVRPYEDMNVVKSTVRHGLDHRFSIKLVSIVENTNDATSVEDLCNRIDMDLAQLAQELRDEGYEVEHDVAAGDFESIVSNMLERNEVDLVAYIQRKAGKATFEKGHEHQIHRLMTMYPGKTMALRRVG